MDNGAVTINKREEGVFPKTTTLKKIVKLWITSFKEPTKKFYDLKGYYKDINLWIKAYQSIVLNKGGMTPGPDLETPEGESLSKKK